MLQRSSKFEMKCRTMGRNLAMTIESIAAKAKTCHLSKLNNIGLIVITSGSKFLILV